MRGVSGLLVALVLASCGLAAPSPSASGEAALFFPRHEAPIGFGEPAGLEGSLVFDDGCLLIDIGDALLLPIWPADTKPGVINNLPVVLLADDTLIVETGPRTLFAGADVEPDRARQYLAGVPDDCIPDRFWLVTAVYGGR